MSNQNSKAPAEFADKQLLGVRRLYVKDASFEAPNTPMVFSGWSKKPWAPDLTVDFSTTGKKLQNDVYEVVVHISVIAKNHGEVAFLAEVDQAGVFDLMGFSDEELGPVLGGYCPDIVYPYAREAISNLVSKGGFPTCYLKPLSFGKLYDDHESEANETRADDVHPED